MNKKRWIATALSAFMLVGSVGMSMTACGDLDEEDSSSTFEAIYNVPGANKMEIKIKNFGMGPGNLWLEETMERFAEANQNTKYGDKTGVYLKYESTNNQNTKAMAGDSTNIFFDERMSNPYELAQNNLLLNLDSIVKNENRVGGKLEDKIFDAAKGGIMQGESYYALPHYEFFGGIAYNRSTFEDLNAYFAAEDEDYVETYDSSYGSANFIADEDAVKSNGPDGKPDTEDDGLPCSLEEFIILCDYIKEKSGGEIAPITISGEHYLKYADYLLIGVWSALAGPEQMRNYYNCTGEIEVVARDDNGKLQFTNENLFEGIDYVKKPVTKTVTMAADGSQGWMGNDMAAKYYAYAILDILREEEFFCSTAYSNDNHWDTQMDIYMEGKAERPQAAMLIEGSYWYNESNEKGGFDTYEKRVPNADRKTLDVAWMSMPTSLYTDGAVGRDACFLDIGLAYTMINGNVQSNPALMQACLDFVEYCYSEQELKNFTMRTGITRAISYELNDDEKANLSSYARRLWNARDTVNGSNIVAWSGNTEIFNAKKMKLKIDLNSGVFGSEKAKAAALLIATGNETNRAKLVQDAFSSCTMYGSW